MSRLADIAQCLRDDISSGQLKLGERITIDQIATRYGASHMPVREAFRTLAGENLIDMQPGRGASIRQIDRLIIENLFETRMAVEAVMARGATRNRTEADIAGLEKVEEMRQAAAGNGDYALALSLNRKFHSLLNSIADNPQARQIVDNSWIMLAAAWHKHGYSPERFAGVTLDHANILRAMRAGDGDGAATFMSAHVLRAKYDLLDRLAQSEVPAKRDRTLTRRRLAQA